MKNSDCIGCRFFDYDGNNFPCVECDECSNYAEDDRLDNAFDEGYKQGRNDAIDECILYFDNLITKGIYNTSPFIAKEYLEKLKEKAE